MILTKTGWVMRRRKKWPVVLALWIIFIFLVACVTYLSFQNGEDARALGKQVIVQIAESQHQGEAVTQEELDAFTYEIRQSGRIVVFLLIGIVGTITIHVSFRKSNWLIKTAITAVILVAIAYFTEKLKIYIPSRHYSYEEMLISITAVTVGFSVVSIITLVCGIVKGFFRLMTTSHI